jgi:hypothetical protein
MKNQDFLKKSCPFLYNHIALKFLNRMLKILVSKKCAIIVKGLGAQKNNYSLLERLTSLAAL